MNKPYRAPIYQTYGECLQGLYRQGVLGFYKGNACRCAHVIGYDVFRIRINQMLDTDDAILKRNSFWKDLVAATTASVLLHPLHYAEARLVLNNRLPNFSAYKSAFTLATSSVSATSIKDIFRGVTIHLPRSVILAFSGFNYSSSATLQSFIASHLAFHTLAYPLLTVQRRLECQSVDRPGMIPQRYLGPIHATGLMLREEGLRGLYRGYTAYLLATVFYITVVPLLTEASMFNMAINGSYKNETDDLYDQVKAGRIKSFT